MRDETVINHSGMWCVFPFGKLLFSDSWNIVFINYSTAMQQFIIIGKSSEWTARLSYVDNELPFMWYFYPCQKELDYIGGAMEQEVVRIELLGADPTWPKERRYLPEKKDRTETFHLSSHWRGNKYPGNKLLLTVEAWRLPSPTLKRWKPTSNSSSLQSALNELIWGRRGDGRQIHLQGTCTPVLRNPKFHVIHVPLKFKVSRNL